MPSGNLVRRAYSSFLLVLVSWIQSGRVNSRDDGDIRHAVADPPTTAAWLQGFRDALRAGSR
jgi:hypothetical protein